jgi:hypothetical protein
VIAVDREMDDIPSSPAPPRLVSSCGVSVGGDGGRPREDYEVIDVRGRGEKVGRMYRTIAVGGGEAWNWTVYGIAVTNHPPAGCRSLVLVSCRRGTILIPEASNARQKPPGRDRAA